MKPTRTIRACVRLILPLFAIFANAEEPKNLVINGNASEGLNNWINVQSITDGGPDGSKCFEVTGQAFVSSQEFIPVDPNSEYQLTGWFRSGNGQANNIYGGLLLFDENQRPIDSTSVNVLPKSETGVLEARRGEKVIKVQDASTWQPLLETKHLSVAFDADDSGEYKDLPNYKCYRVDNLKEKGGFWEVALTKPLASDFTEGSKVRAHVSSASYMYAYIKQSLLSEWTEFGSVIKPIVKFGAPNRTFWPGTKYAKILIFANWEQTDGEILQFDNISLEKVKP
jgi:hypothetical protein